MVEQAAGRIGPTGIVRAGRRQVGAASEAAGADRGVGWVKICVLAVFLACLLVPGSFYLGESRFTPYRMFLLAAGLPLIWRFLRGGAGRPTLVDGLALLYAAWIALALVKHEGLARYDYIVIQLVEAIGGYLLGRTLVRGAADYRALFVCFLFGLLVLAPFAAIEMLTERNLFNELAAGFLEPFDRAEHAPRLGLHRAQGPFEHPILFGLFCSLGFANACYIFRQEPLRRIFWMAVAFFTTFASLSSAPLLAMLIQTLMMVWDRLVRAARSKWLLLAAVGAAALLLLQMVTPDGAVAFLVEHLTLVPDTAEYRILTLQHAMETVRANPTFGVGHEGTVDLPWWHTGSIDNFWLSLAVDYGLPATLLLIGLIGLHLWRVMMATGLDATAAACRSGHLIALVGLIFTLTTVHLWGSANVMVMAYLGAGASIYAPPAEAARRRDRPPEPARRTPAPPARVPAAAPRARGSTARYGGRR